MIKLVKAKKKDSNFFFILRNEKNARENSQNQKEISIHEHKKWFLNAVVNNNFKLYKINLEGVNCGYIRLQKIKKKIFVSIYILPKYRNRNIASSALINVEKYLKNDKFIFAFVKFNNPISKKLFLKNGYVISKKNGKFILMKKKLGKMKVIDQIESIRGKNNFNWMNLLRLAYRNAPQETSAIMAKIYKDDQKISKLIKKLMK